MGFTCTDTVALAAVGWNRAEVIVLLVVLDYFTASSSLVQIKSCAFLAASTSEASALISVADEKTFSGILLLHFDFQSCCFSRLLGNKVFSERGVPGLKQF